MLSSLDPAAVSFLNSLDRIQRRTQNAQRELTTGLRLNTVSDDPSQVPDLFQTRARLDRTTQIDSNLGQVKTEVDASEGAVQSAVQLVDRAQSLGTQGQSSYNTTEGRASLAAEVGGVLQQLVGLSNTNVNGRYVFSGDSDQKAAYAVDLSQTNPVSSYAGTAATRQVEHPDGSLFSVSKTAQQLLDNADPRQNVFQAVTALRNALLNGDQSGINTALSNLSSAGAFLNGQLSFYGNLQNRVSDASNFGSGLEAQLTTRLSAIQDADLTQAITEFQQANNSQQAALESRAKLPHTSLFDYLA